MVSWNKGLTKYSDKRIANNANALREKKKTFSHCANISKGLKGKPGHTPWNKGLTISVNPTLARSEETRKKQSVSHLGKKYTNRKRPNSIMFRLKCSIRMNEFWASPSRKAARIKRIIESSHQRPTSFEVKLGALINKTCPNEYKYVGDGSVILGGICPDFINTNGQKKVIEGFGDYWHSPEVTKNQSWNRTELGRVMAYSSLGYDCLVIWESELDNKSESELISIIKSFNKENIESRK